MEPMRTVIMAVLPAVNAVLIFTSGLVLMAGVAAVRRGDRRRHQRLMLVATTLSTLFFVLYVTRISLGGLTPFRGPLLVKWVYLSILVSHVTLAAVQVPMTLMTLYLALCGHFPSHRRVARYTYPIWVYVSFTGVLVYGLLHYPYGA
jgi:putative membrane protein